MAMWPFQRSQAEQDGEALLLAVTQVSRLPSFFGEDRVPDTLDGRFELMTLHAALALIRLRAAPEAAPLAQAFADQLFRQFDSGLREAGIGDLIVPKRMHRLARSFYGRVEAYASVIAAQDGPGLEAALSRNMLGARGRAFAPALAVHAMETAACQAAAGVTSLLSPAGWPVRLG